MTHDLKAIFSQNGLLATHLSNYFPRNAQLQMAEKVSQALQQPQSGQKNSVLLCEAGTGTGKTFAYLVPAILSEKQVIISTGTKNLQDQLYHKDLPAIAAILESLTQRKLNYSLLKGRSNYVCLYRFENALNDAWYDEQIQSDLQLIKRYLGQTESADIAEFTMLKEQASVWPVVTSTTENCLGSVCPDHDDCFVLKAREQAASSDMLIVNHHLLMADFKLKNDTLGDLLPAAQAYIIDEAHQLPDIASRFFSRRISSRQIKELFRDVGRSMAKIAIPGNCHGWRNGMPETGAGGVNQLKVLAQDVRKILDDLAQVLRRYRQRGSWSEVTDTVSPLCEEICFCLNKLRALLEPLAATSAELENYYKRSENLLNNFIELVGKTPPAMIHWFECRNKGFAIQLTPLALGREFNQQIQSTSGSWIFTSATLTVNSPELTHSHEPTNSHELIKSQDKSLFSYFAEQLGLAYSDYVKFDSPFDYSHQAILYAPQNLPLPSDACYIKSVIEAIYPIIEWLQGKTFLLFTSYRALHEAREILSGSDFHLLVQGDAPKQQLVNEFKSASGAILLATSSFWEGVDVKGEALSCVVIDKLPFASPQDPVLQARVNNLQQQGKNAFYQYQLPLAAMSLKQGCGRLIRAINDCGILVVADPRFFSKNYGYYLRQCLPEMPIETDFVQLQKKFTRMQKKIITAD
ncbi:MAG: ATP-dependent DNA helicase [Gammaproteobacteria bacterium]|nr:ATP-dependent DNA helicase [Gammaproteobacteria bacterium]